MPAAVKNSFKIINRRPIGSGEVYIACKSYCLTGKRRCTIYAKSSNSGELFRSRDSKVRTRCAPPRNIRQVGPIGRRGTAYSPGGIWPIVQTTKIVYIRISQTHKVARRYFASDAGFAIYVNILSLVWKLGRRASSDFSIGYQHRFLPIIWISNMLFIVFIIPADVQNNITRRLRHHYQRFRLSDFVIDCI